MGQGILLPVLFPFSSKWRFQENKQTLFLSTKNHDLSTTSWSARRCP